jgi:replicative DNA helicase
MEAEGKYLGSIFLDPNRLNTAMLEVRPEHFWSIPYKYIYEAMCQLFTSGSPVTPDTVAQLLGTKKDLDKTKLELAGGKLGIISTMQGADEGEFEFWSDVVKKKYEERQLLEFAEQVKKSALSNPENIHDIRSKLEAQLIQLGHKDSGGKSVSIENAIPDLDIRIQRYIDNPDDILGLTTGYKRLDKLTDGLQRGNVSILYAPSSRFKSLFATNIGWRLADQNFPGLWFTTEMPRVQVLERLLQLEAGVNLRWLRENRQIIGKRKELKLASQRLSELPINFCDTSALEVAEIRTEVNRHKRWNNIEYIIVDLIDHVSSSRFRDEMVNNQRAVMAAMKQMAKDFDIHVFLVSHVSKGSKDTRGSADLDVEEMIGSAAKYQDVDTAISIGPVKYNQMNELVAMDRGDILAKVAEEGRLDVLVSVTKNRHGQLDRFVLELDFHKGGRFLENGWIEMKQEKLPDTDLTENE